MAIKFLNTYQSIDYGNILQPLANFTACGWFYPTKDSIWRMFFGREDLSGPGWHLELNSSDRIGWHSDNGSIEIYSTTITTLNTWYFCCGVRDTTTGTQRLYINGAQEASGAYGSLSTVVSNLRIGQPDTYPTQGLIGVADDLRFYNRVLTDNEIITIYACEGCDSITDGLQFRQIFTEGYEEQPLGSLSTPAINNVQNTSSASSGSSLTLSSYTAPTGSNLVLVVVATAESTTSSRVQATNITFNGSALTQRATTRTTTSTYNGVDIWSKTVTSGETGNIVVTWSGSNSRKTILAYTLSNTVDLVQETATSYSNTGATTTGLTTITDKAIVVTGCANRDDYTLTAVGTNHSVNSTLTAGIHAGAIGNVPVTTAGTISGIGFTASTMTGSALALVAFTPYNTTETVTELSNNKYTGTALYVPTYTGTYLKTRRRNG